MSTTIELPRRRREGSITDEQVDEVHAALLSLTGERQAVVVGPIGGFGSEHSARNKARSMAVRYEERHGRKLSAHAVPHGEAKPDGTYSQWTAAVSVRKPKPESQQKQPESKSENQKAPAKSK